MTEPRTEEQHLAAVVLRAHGNSQVSSGTFVLMFECPFIRQCQHRWTPIANMVAFSNAAGTTGLTQVMTSGNNLLSYGRGESFTYTIALKLYVI